MTPEERESIVNEAVERALRVLPEVVGNLMKANAIYSKLNKDFYAQNPDLKEHREIVKEVVARTEGQDPTKKYEDILKDSLPKIREQIRQKSGLSMRGVERKDLILEFNADNGEI